MNDYFNPQLGSDALGGLSVLALAHIGDAVYELLTRTRLVESGVSRAGELHRKTVSIVNAPAQAEAAARLLPALGEEERALFRRGRNAKVNSVPHGADIAQYHAATALEALFGWLYLQGKTERINELYALCAEDEHGA